MVPLLFQPSWLSIPGGLVGGSFYLRAGQRAFCVGARDSEKEGRKRELGGWVQSGGEMRMQQIQVKALCAGTRIKCRNPEHTLVLISM